MPVLNATLALILVLGCSPIASAQNTAAQSSSDAVATLRVDVNLVPLHVVVRDAHGKAVAGLNKEDFQVYDQGRLQVISQFSVEHIANPKSGASSEPETAASAPHTSTAQYTAYLFDDLHMEATDLMVARTAAGRHLAALSPENERAAIFTTSGQKGIDFTADRAKLHEVISHLEPKSTPKASDCPSMSSYMADLIANKGDQDALSVAARDALQCEFDNNPKGRKAATQLAEAAARETIERGQTETQRTLHMLKALVQGMSKAPGQRTIVVISPGFFISDDQDQVQIMDLAVRGEVTVSALDPRGLVTGNDITNENSAVFDAHNPGKRTYEFMGAQIEQATLDELTDATGGIFFHNNNDLDEGFKRVGAPPEYSYNLAFAPQNTKLDGRYHKLKVTLARDQKLTVQARKGYYAPKKNP
jgi:VWFA-related protein